MTEIFVFGSNLAGRHGRGAAKHALESWGAVYGQGEGPQGNSYAIPTKGYTLETLTLATIRGYVWQFLQFARAHPDLTFKLTAIGCGLAGYKPDDIAPMFEDAPPNVKKPIEFYKFWLVHRDWITQARRARPDASYFQISTKEPVSPVISDGPMEPGVCHIISFQNLPDGRYAFANEGSRASVEAWEAKWGKEPAWRWEMPEFK